MRIRSVSAALPQTILDNDAVLAMFEQKADLLGRARSDTEAVVKRARQMLNAAGSAKRHADPDAKPGYAMDLVRQAAAEALAKASISADDLDLIIYCSVSRGWMEPSTASAVQAAIGAGKASCFDVLEACAGWMRALELADALLRTGRYRTAMVTGVEAGMSGHLMPEDPGVTYGDEHMAAVTLGEAATAVIVTADSGQPLVCDIRSDGRLHDICMIPLANMPAFMPDPSHPVPRAGHFFSKANQLFPAVISALVEMMKPKIDAGELDDVAMFVVHGASARAAEVLRLQLGICPERWLCTHAQFGNTVSMSMPVSLNHALETGLVSTGDKVCFLVASAGISYGYGVLTC